MVFMKMKWHDACLAHNKNLVKANTTIFQPKGVDYLMLISQVLLKPIVTETLNETS